MKIIPQKDSTGKDVPGKYLVIVPSLFGGAVLFGPASFADCERFVVAKMRELMADLDAQFKAEKARLAAEQKKEQPRGMACGPT